MSFENLSSKKFLSILGFKMKSLFGPFNLFVDELVHGLLSLILVFIGYYFGLDLNECLILFLTGYLIDIDHLLNPLILKYILKVKDQNMGIIHGSNGYSIRILHGLDTAFVISLIVYFLNNNLAFSIFLFLILTAHELWDFAVYHFNWKELFFITRANKNFIPGSRKYFVGKIFDEETLKF